MRYYSVLPCEYNFKSEIKEILLLFKNEIEVILNKINSAENSLKK